MPASAGTVIEDEANECPNNNRGRAKMLRDCAKLLKRSQSAFACRRLRLESACQQRTERHRAEFIAPFFADLCLLPERLRTLSGRRVRGIGGGGRRRTGMRCGPARAEPRSARHRSLSCGCSRSLRRRVSRATRIARARVACRSAATDVRRCIRHDGRLCESGRNDDLECFGRMRLGAQAHRGNRMGDEHRKRWPRETPVTRASCGSRHQ